MTKREAISNVKTILKKINADNRVTNKQIDTILNKHANWLMERESETFKLGRRSKINQSYKCATVIDVPKVDPCCGITTKCVIKRTKEKIPDLFEDSLGVMIKSVSSIDNSTELNSSTISSYPSKKESPWIPKTEKFYFYQGGYIYGDLPKQINILAVFKEEVIDCNKCKRYLDKEWMISEKLQAQAIEFAIKEMSISIQIVNQEKIDKNENK